MTSISKRLQNYPLSLNRSLNRPLKLNAPIYNYYIASSHNTYLEGHQLVGKSSIEQYRKTLELGARCLELDCWDGPGYPIIYHGRTLTSKISFKNVIVVINDFIEQEKPYPIILSLEIHCSLKYQRLMADELVEILGKRLVTHEELTPEQARGRVYLKAKRLSFEPNPPAPDKLKLMSLEDKNNELNESKKALIAVRLSKLVYFHSSHDFDVKCQQSHIILSNSELEAVSLLRNDLTTYTQKHLVRIYPKATRIDSSNFNPIPFWLAGFQLVCSNWQNDDLRVKMTRVLCGRSGYRYRDIKMIKNDFKLTLVSYYLPETAKAVKIKLHGLKTIVLKQELSHDVIFSFKNINEPYMFIEIAIGPLKRLFLYDDISAWQDNGLIELYDQNKIAGFVIIKLN